MITAPDDLLFHVLLLRQVGRRRPLVLVPGEGRVITDQVPVAAQHHLPASRNKEI